MRHCRPVGERGQRPAGVVQFSAESQRRRRSELNLL